MGLYIGNNKYKVMIGNQKCSFVTEDSGSILPAGYKQLEYIKSTGQQIILTNIKSTVATDVDIWKIEAVSASTNKTLLIANNSDYNGSWFGVCNGNWSCNETSSSDLSGMDKTSLFVRFEIINYLHTATITKDDYSWTFQRTFSAPIKQTNIQMFSSPIGYPFLGKLYFASLTRNNVLIAEFIPCISPNNVVGMYDTVNGVFYSSSSGTAFVAGPEV